MKLTLKMDRGHVGWRWHCLATKAMKKTDVIHRVVTRASEKTTTRSERAAFWMRDLENRFHLSELKCVRDGVMQRPCGPGGLYVRGHQGGCAAGAR